MEFTQEVKVRDERVKAYSDIDVSNWSEFAVVILQCVIANMLLQLIFWKIKGLFQWKQDDPQNDPQKMLKVNSILGLVMIFKIFSFYYAISGFIFSKMWLWDCRDDNKLTINPNIYVTFQILDAQALNFAFCYCTHLWLKLWRLKLSMEQKKTLLILTFYTKYVVLAIMWCIPIITIISIFSIFNDGDFEKYALGTLTIISTVFFIAICFILSRKLKDFYNVGEKYLRVYLILNQNLKVLSIVLIFCAVIRPAINIWLLKSSSLYRIKESCQEEQEDPQTHEIIKLIFLPDLSVYWYSLSLIERALFQFFYVTFTDFIPVYIISKLFSPNQQKRKPLVRISSGWDDGLE